MALSAVRFACAVGADESEDAALFDPQIDAVQRDGCAEGLAEAACFYDCHGFGSSSASFGLIFDLRHRGDEPLAPFSSSSAVRPEPLNGGVDPGPFFAQETSGVRPAAADCARRH